LKKVHHQKLEQDEIDLLQNRLFDAETEKRSFLFFKKAADENINYEALESCCLFLKLERTSKKTQHGN
jgi:hypothetical protein